jgi:acyl-ACP thioesterase
MQETAWNALKEWGPKPEYLKKNNFAFILSKISFKYYHEICEDDIIKVETWAIPPSKNIIFVRNYRIYKNETVAAEATSAWALMDMKERAILKPEILGDNFKGFDSEELDFTVQKRFKIPENPAELREYKVRYADIDTNFHMNNVVYIDLISECLYNENEKMSPDLKKQVLSIDLNYNSEAVFGDMIEISKISKIIETNTENGDVEEIYLTGKVKSVNINNTNCFEAKAVIKIQNEAEKQEKKEDI